MKTAGEEVKEKECRRNGEKVASSEDEGSKGGTHSTQRSKYSGSLGVKNERIKGKIRKTDSPGLGKMRG